jgi:hypothetical protein
MRAVIVYKRLRSSTRRGGDAPDRGAFTIFELLMVLAVMVMIVGLLWPALENLHTEYSLRQAGQLVQSRMAGARVHAIDMGVPYQFRYEPGGRHFLVLPFDTQVLATQAGGGAMKTPRVAGTLPSARAGFDSTGTLATGGQPVATEWLAGLANADEFMGVNWSAPVIFHPDGTAGAARIMIRDNKLRFVTVSVRPLTGGVSVSKIEKGGTH